MVLEIAQIEVKPGLEPEFEAGVAKAAPIFKRAKGCKGLELQRSVETPGRYRLFVTWETVENHTVDFRARRIFRNGAGSSATASPRRPKSSTPGKPGNGSNSGSEPELVFTYVKT